MAATRAHAMSKAGGGGGLEREDYTAWEWSMLCLFDDVVGEMTGLVPWSRKTLFDESAREVEALRHLRGTYGRLRRQDAKG